MTHYIATTFRVPKALAMLARLGGVCILSQTGLEKRELGAFLDVGNDIWSKAQIAARRAFIAVRDGAATPVPTACRALGLDEKYGRDALAQWLSQDALYRLNFVHVCRHAFPDAIVIADFPPALVRELCAVDFRFHLGLSRAAWIVRRFCLVVEALAAHLAHFLLCIRDVFHPSILGLSPDAPLVLWTGLYDSEFGWSEDTLNTSDFIADHADLFPHDITVVCEAGPAARHAPPVRLATDLFPLRRTGQRGAGALLGDLALQIRLAWAVVAGNWVEPMMGRECAKLPRARACLSDLKPHAVNCTIGQLQYLPIWIALARQESAPLRVFCNSTQIFPIQPKQASIANVVPDIYMLLSADEYLVWDDAHAADMATAGAPPNTIRMIGPIIMSGKHRPGSHIQDNDGAIIIDYFDQPPCSHLMLIRIGAPKVHHMPERLISALEDVIAAAEIAFAGRNWTLRIKSKRKHSDQIDDRYGRRITELTQEHPNLMLVDPLTSPLALHSNSTVTIGFPFVSPVVSAVAAGIISVFYSPDGSTRQPGRQRDIPVLHGCTALADWLAAQAITTDRHPTDSAAGGGKA